jgi:hypothetical protein
MPVVLPDDAYALWLYPGFQKADAICDLLKPFDPNLMRRFEVSNRVNLVKNNDDPACAEPVVRLSAAAMPQCPEASPHVNAEIGLVKSQLGCGHQNCACLAGITGS